LLTLSLAIHQALDNPVKKFVGKKLLTVDLMLPLLDAGEER